VTSCPSRPRRRLAQFTVGGAKNYAGDGRRALTTPELRTSKSTRDEFRARPRRPIRVVLDGVSQNYNIGAIFRLCDAFLVQQLVVCGTKVQLHKRRLVQAAQGTQHWMAWTDYQNASQAIADLKARGAWVVVAEQTTASVRPEQLRPAFPATLVLGGERSGVSPEALEAADAAVAIPILEWRTRSTSRPLLPFCFTGFLRGWWKERELDCQLPRILRGCFPNFFRHRLPLLSRSSASGGRGHAPRADQRIR
jgi:tRNA(Leu) C34 or U34 (ribose-2'-O)-methylase TrmL